MAPAGLPPRGTLLDSHDTGLLITVDEVHKHAREDMRDLATTFQHLVREDRNVALAMAGLPSAVSDLLNDDVLTFLRRATKEVLADVPLDDVRRALQETITTEGRTTTPGPHTPPTVAQRMGEDMSYAGVYRSRLIDGDHRASRPGVRGLHHPLPA